MAPGLNYIEPVLGFSYFNLSFAIKKEYFTKCFLVLNEQITVIKILPQTSGFNRIYEHEIELARAGVGKVRPAGQIRPTEALNTARGLPFTTQCP